MSSAICFNLNQSKILSSGNGLSVEKQTAQTRRHNANYRNPVSTQ